MSFIRKKHSYMTVQVVICKATCMVFSKIYNISRNQSDNWFDPILIRDTKLFIDPFLLFESKDNLFKDSYDKTIAFFDKAFEIAAVSKKSESDIRYKQLKRMMNFPEVEEICLGYSESDTAGSGSGGKFSKIIVDSIYESLELGIKNYNFFEEIGLFNLGFGCDRISDMTATLIKKELIEYTQEVCDKHEIPTKSIKIHQYEFSKRFNKWESKNIELPINPYNNKAIILVPEKFLRELPTINADDFWNYCWDNSNEELREQYSIEVKGGIRKADLIQIARQNRDWVNNFENFLKKQGSTPYDIIKDSRGLYQWVNYTEKYTSENQIKDIKVSTSKEFETFVQKVIDNFVHFIENNSGYKLLWNDNKKHKKEEAVQLLFYGIVVHYCQANNIDLNREVNLGRGPVDFKFSTGYQNKYLIEIKQANNSKFWAGIETQLTKYLEVEKDRNGVFIAVCYSEKELTSVGQIEARVDEINKKLNLNIKAYVIDATPEKPSASKL